MKIQVKSDVHHEFTIGRTRGYTPGKSTEYARSQDADVLVLAGDIFTAKQFHLFDRFYGHDPVKGIPTLLVPGNHEYYDGDMYDVPYMLQKELTLSKINLLDTNWKVIDNVLFVGATLWTNLMNPMHAMLSSNMNDFRVIKSMTPERWTSRFHRDHNYIQTILKHQNFRYMKKVVITHFLPSEQSVADIYKGSDLNCFFVGNCDEMFNQDWSPELWIHGHTHSSCDYSIGKTRVVCNPYGYWPKAVNPEFNPELIVEI